MRRGALDEACERRVGTISPDTSLATRHSHLGKILIAWGAKASAAEHSNAETSIVSKQRMLPARKHVLYYVQANRC